MTPSQNLAPAADEKKQAAQGEARAAWLAKSSGEEGKTVVILSETLSCLAKDLGGLREASHSLRRNDRASSPLPYIDDGLPVAGVPLTVLVMRRTSTRRLSARPLAVLFDSTGLSFPRPIT